MILNTDSESGRNDSEIAVIGLAGRFPGAGDIEEFWHNLTEGRESIDFFSEAELQGDGIDPLMIQDGHYVKAKGVLEGIEYFDAPFFGYTRREASMMDPQLRLFHECAWQALEHAGYDPGRYEEPIGLYAGIAYNMYWLNRLFRQKRILTDQFEAGILNDRDFSVTRISYKLDLRGPALTVQTACSTSLVAVHLACQALLAGECTMALAGGVSIVIPQKSGYLYQEGMTHSPDGHCRPFDSGANGTVFGDGIGLVVLRTLETAAGEGDFIHAVIKGTAVNNDGGCKTGYTAPSTGGQAAAVRVALKVAGVDPGTITYIETHGTGTRLGDPIELEALKAVFPAPGAAIAIGAVKANVGHLNNAAGITGLIKTVLAIRHRLIPPLINFEAPNPELDIGNSRFYVNTRLKSWPEDGYPRRAGVSSFGVGGTNAHLILEEAPHFDDNRETSETEKPERTYRLILLSARHAGALDRQTRNLGGFLSEHPHINLDDAAYTLQVGRRFFDHRRLLVCSSRDEAVKVLTSASSGAFKDRTAGSEDRPVVFLFDGLGAQYENMGREIYETEPIFRREMDRCFEILRSLTACDLKEILFPRQETPASAVTPPSLGLDRIDIAQVAVFAFEYSLARLLMEWGIRPESMIGYSFGEYTAACLAGVFSLETALKSIVFRGELLMSLPDGAMLSVPRPADSLLPLPDSRLAVAIDNGSSCVVAGPPAAVSAFEEGMKKERCLCVRLTGTRALHSPMMEPVLTLFQGRLAGLTMNEPKIPFISNVTGLWSDTAGVATPAYWSDHLRRTVRFAAGIEQLAGRRDALFIEIGPGRELTPLVSRFLQNRKDWNQHIVNLIKPAHQEGSAAAFLMERLGRLWLYGKKIDWAGFHGPEKRCRLPLPGYPFDKHCFPIDMKPEPVRKERGRSREREDDQPVENQVSAPVQAAPKGSAVFTTTATPVEKKLAEIWQDYFGIDAVGIDDDFFELGGDSLKASQVMAMVHRAMSVAVPLAVLFKTPTIRGIARYFEGAVAQEYAAACPTEKREYYPLSSAQKRLYILQQMEGENTAYNEVTVARLTGPLDQRRLKLTFEKLLQRHESLRTSFDLVADEPVQYIHDSVRFNLEYLDRQPEAAVNSVIDTFIRPFDLSRPPLFRVGLLNTKPNRHILVVDMHHIVTDGTSSGILVREFMASYSGSELPPLLLQYKDYSCWQRSTRLMETLGSQREFWLELYSGDIPVLNLPLSEARPSVQSFDGNIRCRVLDETVTRRLKEMAAARGATLFMVILAAYTVLLHRLGGQEDIVVGTPVAGRRQPDLQHVVGMFVNTLALRNFPRPDMTFAAFLEEVKEAALPAFENQDYQFEDLVEQLSLKRDASRNPLFDVMFVLQNMDTLMTGMEVNDLKLSPYEYRRKVAQFDLILNIIEIDGRLNITFAYSTRLFNETTVNRIVGYFDRILGGILDDADLKLGRIPLLSVEERRQIMEMTTGRRSPVWTGQTIAPWWERQVGDTPDRVALVETGSNRFFTYRDLNGRANRLARRLRSKGSGPDRIVGLMMDRSLEMMTALLAIIKSGAAYLPIDADYPPQRISYMIRDSGLSLLLTGRSVTGRLNMTSLLGRKTGPVEPVVTAGRGQITDFDSLPPPDRTLIDYRRYQQYIGLAMAKHTVSLQASRGCPFGCAFCHKIWPKNHVARSAEHIFKEMTACMESGVRRFVFVDDVFNLDKKRAAALLEKIIHHRLELQLFFPNGLRGDILTPEFIDMMIEAGTVNIALALESASPRIQKLIRKNLNLEKFAENARYLTRKYPRVLLEMELMIGFPGETESEALMTLDFLKSLKWVHFPNLHLLKIYPNTEMWRIAIENGVDEERLTRSADLAYHELTDTLPFSGAFVRRFQSEFLNGYFLNRQRLRQVLPSQMEILTEDELVQKYDSYLPTAINRFDDILKVAGISFGDLGGAGLLKTDPMAAPEFSCRIRKFFPSREASPRALRLLLLDLSLLFGWGRKGMLYDVIEEPLGLMYLLSYLNERFNGRVAGRILKSRIDFDSFAELRSRIEDFSPHLIGIRSLTFYREFFHQAVAAIRSWGIETPVIAGGPYATSDYAFLLQDVNVDLAVLGEGEHTLAELIDTMLSHENRLPPPEVLGRIPGIAFLPAEDKRRLRRSRPEILCFEDISAGKIPVADLETLNQPEDLVYVMYTSGSTGRPKGVMLTHRNVLNLIRFQFHWTNIDCSRILQFTTLSFDVSFQEIFSALLSGGTLFLINSGVMKDIPRLFEVIREQAVNTLFLPASFLRFILGEPDYIVQMPTGVDHIVTAGEQLLVTETFRDYLKYNKVYLHNHYGPAETHVVTTLTIGPEEEIPSLPAIGRPLSNTEIFILNPEMKPQGVGQPGEIYIGGFQVGRGYLSGPDLTIERFGSHPLDGGRGCYRTGDLARWRPDGNIEFLGRIDSQVKIRGFRIEPGEIENHLLAVDGIREAVVVHRVNRGGDRSLYAYLVAGIDLRTSAVKEILARKLPDYMIPSHFIQLQKIPLLPNGKVDRRALPGADTRMTVDHFTPPGDAVEKRLAALWTDVLPVRSDRLGIDDNFFDLGGHSLRATVLIERISREFHIKVPLSEMFKTPTIRGIGDFLKGGEKSPLTSIPLVEKRDCYPQSSAQKRLFFLDRFEEIGTRYNMPALFAVEGNLDTKRLEQCFREVICRHEALRTSLVMVDGQPVQRIRQNVDFEIEYYSSSENSGSPGGDGSVELTETLIRRFIRPFDLGEPPLLRVGLADHPYRPKGRKISSKGGSATRCILMFDMHHIICDGTSMGILIDEVTRLYNGEALAPLPIQYKDFACWQNKLLTDGRIASQEDYWINKYRGQIPVLQLPTDQPRPALLSFRGGVLEFMLDLETSAGFIKWARENDVTLFMGLLAVYYVLLFKYSGQDEIVVGSGTAGRHYRESRSLIGMFVNSLALRSWMHPQIPFHRFLQAVKGTCVEAFENQDLQFEELVDRLNLERVPSRNPLFDVSLVVQNFELPEIRIEGLRFVPLSFENRTSKFDLTLFAWEEPGTIRFYLEYCRDLFFKETIQRLIGHFRCVILQVIQRPDAVLGEIDMLGEGEKRQLVYDFNRTVRDLPPDLSIRELTARQVKRVPHHIALLCSGENRQTALVSAEFDNRHLTYRELDRRADRLADYLLRGRQVRPGEAVAVLMERVTDWIAAVLGILKIGAVYVPLDPAFPEYRMRRIIIDAAVGVVISARRYIRTLNRLQWECPCFHTFLCLDTDDIYAEEEAEKSGLMDQKLWEQVGRTGVDDITAGGWRSSYTGEPFTRLEMDEYGDNILQKLKPLLNDRTKVLEIGCASGITMFRLAPLVKLYYGTDLSSVIIEKNQRRVHAEGRRNIRLIRLAAHEIDRIRDKGFDVVIINSVIQAFHGHNYLRRIIEKSIGLLKDRGLIFIGDIMDQDLKEELTGEMEAFKQANREKNLQTKTDFSGELFVSREFWRDLQRGRSVIRRLEFSRKIYTIENELTRFRYDVLMNIERRRDKKAEPRLKSKYQHDRRELNGFGGTGKKLPHVKVGADDPAYIIYTSGTTGIPRGVVVGQRGIANLKVLFEKEYRIGTGERILQFASVSFDASIWEIFMAQLTGASLLLTCGEILKSPPLFEAFVQEKAVTAVTLPPTFLACLDPLKLASPSRKIFSAGSEAGADLVEKWLGKCDFTNAYGPTETSVCATVWHPAGAELDYPSAPIGRPIFNTAIYILDHRYPQWQPIGVPGELCITGTGLARGYLNHPELTGEKFVSALSALDPVTSRLYRTGDLARRLPDGNLEFLGRVDKQVKVRGYRIELSEIESQLLKHGGISQAVVTTFKDPDGETFLAAYIVAAREGTVDEKSASQPWRDYLSARLPGYMIPAHFTFLPEIPLTLSGKVDHRALPIPGAVASTGRPEFRPPTGKIQEQLVSIWSQVLGIERSLIGSRHNFFELGGHSLKAAVLVEEIHKGLQVRLPLAEVFKNPYIEDIAAYIKRQQGRESYSAIRPTEKKDVYPQSSAQKRLFFLDQFEEIGTSYNMPAAFRVIGPLDSDQLEQCFRKLIRRHESLRTAFRLLEGEPVQQVREQVNFEIEYMALPVTGITSAVGGAMSEPGADVDMLMRRFVRPFDLSSPPLFRVGLLSPVAAGSILLFDMHHIVSDGTSMGILVNEVVSLYSGKELPDLPLQYVDFTLWQSGAAVGDLNDRQEDYWKAMFADGIPVLDLPADYPRPPLKSFAGADYYFSLDREVMMSIIELGRQTDVTLFMSLTAVFTVLLHIYSGQDDMVVGIGTAGRRHADLQRLIGMFVNSLPLRLYPHPQQTFRQFLQAVKQISIRSFENQDIQFEELVERLQPKREPSRHPLFDVCLVVQNFELPEIEIKGLQFKPCAFENRTAKLDLSLYVQEQDHGVTCRLEYCRDLFSPQTIRRMAVHMENIIRRVAVDPEIFLASVDLLSEAERRQLIFDFNRTDRVHPSGLTVHELFNDQAAMTPQRIAVVGSETPGTNGGEEPVFPNCFLTFGEMNRRAGEWAEFLQKGMGIRSGEGVGIWLEGGLEFTLALLGILKAGAAYIPVDPSRPEAAVKRIIDDAGIGVMIASKRYIKSLDRLQWECSTFHTFVCPDSTDMYGEVEFGGSSLMDKQLWEHIGRTAADDIAAGGWQSSYTGEPMSRAEMDEYAGNILAKLRPFLHEKVKVLEIGCASGITMFRLAPLVGLYYGTDLSAVIIENNRRRIRGDGCQNIRLAEMAAHEIHRLVEKDFDLVVINSVIQAFPHHNYLRLVIRRAVELLKERGHLFIGDIMDLDLKGELIKELTAFRRINRHKGYRTKTDFSDELFISRRFWQDLQGEVPEIRRLEFSRKIHTLENELTRFRYDTLLYIDKQCRQEGRPGKKHKYQYDAGTLTVYKDQDRDDGGVPEDPAYIIYTSGTTGQPKGVVVEHRNLSNYINWRRDHLGFSAVDASLQLISPAFDGFIANLFPALLSGGRVVMAPRDGRLDAEFIHRLIACHRVTNLSLVPSLYDLILSGEAGRALRSIRFVVLAGEKAAADLIRRSRRLLPGVLHVNEYGPTENTVATTAYRGMTADSSAVIGAPISNNVVVIMDKLGRLQPIGVSGELYAGGASLARGYLNHPEMTAHSFIRTPLSLLTDHQRLPVSTLYRTGDLARWQPDGNIELLGRLDLQVKIRGYRIELEEVESHLRQHDDVAETVVTAVKTDGGGHHITAYLVLRPGGNAGETLSRAKDFLIRRLPDYMIPTHFVELEKIPLTAGGKVNRQALPEPGVGPRQHYTPPRSDTERSLAGIWSEILGLDRRMIGIDDDFFRLGGHSLKAAALVSAIHRRLGVRVPLAEIFNTPDVRGVAGYIESVGRQDGYPCPAIRPVEDCEYYPQSSVQRRLFFLGQWRQIGTSYHMPTVFKVEGKLDRRRLQGCFRQLIRRHESLRTSFRLISSQAVQIVHSAADFKLEYYEPDGGGRRTDGAGDFTDTIIRKFIRPFDLATPPLLRVGLIGSGAEESWLLFDIHHLVSDGTSINILVRELTALYGGEELPDVKLRYRDYCRRYHNDVGRLSGRGEYWLKEFEQAVPLLNLPRDYARSEHPSFEGGTLRFSLEKDIQDQLRELGAAENVTPFMVYLALLNVLLLKLGDREDIVVGTVVEGREDPGLESIVGMFVNTLALRNFPDRTLTFKDFLRGVREKTLRAFENSDYPFEFLVERLGIKTESGGNPLFDVMFEYLKVETGEFRLPGITFRSCELDSGTSKFDLTLWVLETGDDLFFSFDYCTRLFKASTVERISRYFREIASAVAADCSGSLEAIIRTSPSGLQELLEQLNEDVAGEIRRFQRCRVFQSGLLSSLERFAFRLAVSWGEFSMTFSQLDRWSLMLGRRLEEAGGSRGSLAGILTDDRPALIAALIGIIRTGGVAVPLDSSLPLGQLVAMAETVDMDLICSDGLMVSPLKNNLEIRHRQLTLVKMEAPNEGHVPAQHPAERGMNFSPEEAIYVYFTSGTTGRPRAILGRNNSLLHFVCWEIGTFGLRSGGRFSQFISPGFDAFLRDIFVPFFSGGTVCIPGHKEILVDGGKLADWIHRNCICLIHCVPSLFRLINPPETAGSRFRALKHILLSGEKLDPAESSRWYECCGRGTQLVNLYGPTETTMIKSAYHIRPEDGERDRLPVGRPLTGAAAAILTGEMNLCDRLVSGEINILTPFGSLGYCNEPDLSGEKFISDPFGIDPDARLYRTGDLGRIQGDGTLELLGRLDRQVKIRGIRVELAEIEILLNRHPRVRGAAVVHRLTGGQSQIFAYVRIEGRSGGGKKSILAGLADFLREGLPDYMIPSRIINIPQIPLKPNGKVNYDELPEPLPEQSQVRLPPADPLEARLWRIWRRILGSEDFDHQRRFFEAGGNSLMLAPLLADIHSTLGVEIPLGELFKHQTIASQAGLIRSMVKTVVSPVEPVEQREYYRLSSQQKRLYVLQQLERESIGYNISTTVMLEGSADPEAWQPLLARLVRRHESLRTSFEMIEGEPVQRIYEVVDFKIDTLIDSKELSPEIFMKRFIRPFDLARPPLLRLGLLKRRRNLYLLAVDMHHIITDGLSMVIFFEDLLALRRGDESVPAKIRYRDYCDWQRDRWENDILKRQERFWLDRFELEAEPLNLPADYTRPKLQSFDGDWLAFIISENDTADLKKLALEHDTTLYMLLLALFYMFLSKIGDRRDIVVGTPVAGRNRREFRDIVGMFVNTLALRSFPHGDKDVVTFLKEVTAGTTAAFENQEYPFEELVERLDLSRDPGRNPLFDVMFAWHNMEMPVMEVRDLTLKPLKYQAPIAKFDLTLQGSERGDTLEMSFEFAVRLFKRDTVQRLSGYFTGLIKQVLASPQQRIADIEITPATERRRILAEINTAAETGPEVVPVTGQFRQQVQRSPHRTAVTAGAGPWLTYRELGQRSSHLAEILKERGVNAGTLVGIIPEEADNLVVGIWGILKSGGAYLALDPDYPRERIRFMLDDSSARHLIAGKRWRVEAERSDCVIRLDDIPEDRDEHAASDYQPGLSNPAYLIFTSGSTGRPKGVVVNHRSLAAYLEAFIAEFPLGPGETVLQQASCSFDAFVEEFFPVLVRGGRLAVPSRKVVPDIWRLGGFIEKQGITLISCSPLMLNEFNRISRRKEGNPLASVHTFISGGDVLKVEYIDELLKFARVYNTYGPTETTVCAAYYHCSRQSEGSLPIGRPIQRYGVIILDRWDRLLPTGIQGEICIYGAGTAEGYLNRPELTAEKFTAPPVAGGNIRKRAAVTIYRSGDRGRYLTDGSIEFMGRLDRQVKIRGYRIELAEIENELMRCESIGDAVIAARQDRQGVLYLAAYVVCLPDGTSDEVQMTRELRGLLAQSLPSFMIPRYLIPLRRLPRTPGGKVDRNALPEPPDQVKSAAYTPPENDIQEILIGLFTEVLGVKGLGTQDNFFELGGDSIKAIQIAARLRQRGLKFDVADLFLSQTVAGLSESVRPIQRRIDQGIVSGPVDLTPIQNWFFRKVPFNRHRFTHSVFLYRPDGFDRGIVRRVFGEIVRHHDALRMVFETGTGEIRQYNRGVSGELFHLSVRDFRGKDEVENRMRRAAQRIGRNIDLAAGPLLRLGLFRTDGGDYLCIVIHHLVIDGISWRIVLEDFNIGYRQAQRGEAVKLADKTDSFRYWSRQLSDYACSREVMGELDYWRAVEEASVERISGNSEAEAPAEKPERPVSLSVVLDEADTSRLVRQANQAYGTEINDILLTALALAVCNWGGISRFLLNLEGHGREEIIPEIDISRTVGWFTCQYPVLLETAGLEPSGENDDVPLADNLRKIKETLRRIPRRGIGYGILRYLTPAEKRMGVTFGAEPEISFNYLGQFSPSGDERKGEIRMAGMKEDVSGGSAAFLCHALEIDGLVVVGQLRLSFRFNGLEFETERVRNLAESFKSYLRRIIDHCSDRTGAEKALPGSDYPDLNEGELENLEEWVKEID